MKLNYNEKELHQLLQDFHDLTKLTLTLYDPEGEWILSYPTKENCFCHYIKTSPEGAALCDASDRVSFYFFSGFVLMVLYHNVKEGSFCSFLPLL